MVEGIRQSWNRHLTSSVPKQEQARTGFSRISTYGAFRRVSCCDFKLISSSLCSSPYKEECREAKIHWNRSTPPNAIKTQVIQTTEQINQFCYFSPYFELFCMIVIFVHIPIQTLIITLLRNLILTVPKGVPKELRVPVRKRYLNGALNISSATW